jgi:hypothetical protein
MGAQVRFVLLKESVHFVAHVEDILATFQIIAEHDDVLERSSHHFEIMLDVIPALPGLLFTARRGYRFAGYAGRN